MSLDNLIYGYFKAIFPNMYHTSDGWYRFDNPFGLKKDKSSAVNFEYHSVMDMRSGLKETTLEYIKLLENLNNIKEVLDFLDFSVVPIVKPYIEPAKQAEETIIPTSLFLYEGETIFKEWVHKYIQKRGFELDYFTTKGCRYCTEGNYYGRLLIPYLNDKGEWLSFTARDFIGQEPTYKNPPNDAVKVRMRDILYNEKKLLEEKVYVVEGIMDALTFDVQNYPAIATGGWQLSNTKINKLINSYAKEIVVVCDRGFYQRTLNQFSFLLNTEKKLKVLNLDEETFKDTNEGGLEKIFKIEQRTPYTEYKHLFT